MATDSGVNESGQAVTAEVRIGDMIRLLDEFDVTIGSFQHILEGYKVADQMAASGATASAFADWWAYKYEVIDAIPHAGALMHRAGGCCFLQFGRCRVGEASQS